MRVELQLILLVIGSVLAIASLAGLRLRVSVREGAMVGTVENLNTRIKAWWWIVLIFGSAVLAGRVAVARVFHDRCASSGRPPGSHFLLRSCSADPVCADRVRPIRLVHWLSSPVWSSFCAPPERTRRRRAELSCANG
jgi:hypothetical protein